MTNTSSNRLQKILFFPVARMTVGIVSVVVVVATCEWLRQLIPDKTFLSADWKMALTGIVQIVFALLIYRFVFRHFEKRKITELSSVDFLRYASAGFVLGLFIQSFVIGLLYWTDHYSIQKINPFSFIVPGLIQSIIAGVVAEILIRGIFFRIVEEVTGTTISLLSMTLLFALLHVKAPGANPISVCAIALQSGLLFSAAFVYSRSLWLPIFLHFSWDLAEPAIYGGLNPGISITTTLINSKITGPGWLTGGLVGPGASLPAAAICLAASAFFVWKAIQGKKWKAPLWS